VWTTFEDCGEIESVRLIRDNQTSIGKGFGYVLFKDQAAVTLALGMKNCKIADREIRIKAAVKKPKPFKAGNSQQRRPQFGNSRRTRRENQNFDHSKLDDQEQPQIKKKKMRHRNLGITDTDKKNTSSIPIVHGSVEKRPKKIKKKIKKNSVKTNVQKGLIHMKKK